MDKSFLEKTLQYDWDMNKVDRSIDPIKTHEYLSTLSDERDYQLVKDIINYTTYINFEIFKKSLIQSFEQFKEYIGQKQFYLLLPLKHKRICEQYFPYPLLGSEHWLVTLLWPQLRHMNLIGILPKDDHLSIPLLSEILIIDDMAYTGIHIRKNILNFIKENPIGSSFNYNLIIPYLTNIAKKNISSMGISYNIYNINTVLSLFEQTEKLYYSEDYSEEIDIQDERFEIIDYFPPIYFDHKIADTTYKNIYMFGWNSSKGEYGTILKQLPSRYKIEELETLFKQYHC